MQRLSRRTFAGFAIAELFGSGVLLFGVAAGMVGLGRCADPTGSVPWLAEVQQAPAALPADVPRLTPLLVDRDGEPITEASAWEARRRELREDWQTYLGSLGDARRHPPEITVVEEDVVDNVVRQRVRYEIEPGIATEAYLLRPREVTGGWHPGVTVFHSTVNHSIRQPAGVEGVKEKAFGLELARRGYVTFCPRNFLWPDNSHIVAQGEAERFLQRHPQAKGMAKMLFDAQVAVDILVAQPAVDAARIGAVGHSLGAKEVLYLAAFDERIRCTVSSEGGIGTTYSNWDAPWYLGPAIGDGSFPREHHELLAMIAPRPFLLIGGDSADGDRSWPFIAAALPVYGLYGQRADIGLLNHRQGHAVPPIAERRIYEWIEAYLGAKHP